MKLPTCLCQEHQLAAAVSGIWRYFNEPALLQGRDGVRHRAFGDLKGVGQGERRAAVALKGVGQGERRAAVAKPDHVVENGEMRDVETVRQPPVQHGCGELLDDPDLVKELEDRLLLLFQG